MRRKWLRAAMSRYLAAAALACLGSVACAETSETPATVPIDQLMAPGLLPDIVQGSPNAPSTIVEYASLTCTHCAAFHETVWPELKAKYVDSGKAKFILRELPLDPLSTAAFMVARCAGPDKRNLVIDQLFSQQKSWAFAEQPSKPLFEIAKQMGMSQSDFENCVKNQQLYDQVNQSRDHAEDAFDIEATPTFFVNGRKLTGEKALADFDRLLEDSPK